MSCRIEPNRDTALPPNWRAAQGGVSKPGQPAPTAETPPASAEELRQARERLVQLERSVEQRVREAHQAGFREGENSGRKQAAAQIDAAVDGFTRSTAELAGLRGRLFREAEADLVKLALEIAHRVLHRELHVDPDAVTGLLKHALLKAKDQEIHRLRVHPEQVARVRASLERLGSSALEVVGDASLGLGSALFETSRGNLDASVETQFHEIEQGLVDRLERQVQK